MAVITYDIQQLLQLRTSTVIHIDFDFEVVQPYNSSRSKWWPKRKEFGVTYRYQESQDKLYEKNFIKNYASIPYPFSPSGYQQMEENYYGKIYPVFDLRKLPAGAKVIRVTPGMPVPQGAVKVPVSALKFKQMPVQYVSRSFDPHCKPFEPLALMGEQLEQLEREGLEKEQQERQKEAQNEQNRGQEEYIQANSGTNYEIQLLEPVDSASEQDDMPNSVKLPQEADDYSQSTLESLDSFNIQIQLPSCGL